MKISELASKVEARLENCIEDLEINGVAPIEEAGPGQIAYPSSTRELAVAKRTRASAVILRNGLAPVSAPMLRSDNPYLVFARVLELFYAPLHYEKGIHPTAVLHPSARIGPNASIGAYVVIDLEVEIGADAVLLPHVVIYRGARIGRNFFAHAHAVVREHCRLGDNVVLQNGAVIGSDGFGFVMDVGGGEPTWKKVMHPGPAVLGDNVEVQANACVNRSEDGETRIGREVKIGDLAHVGHKSSVGEHTVVLPQVALAGGTKVGKEVMLLGQAGVAGCTIADGVIVMGQSGVIDDVELGKVISGSPAIDHKAFLRSFAVFKHLPELSRALRASAVVHQERSRCT